MEPCGSSSATMDKADHVEPKMTEFAIEEGTQPQQWETHDTER